MGTDFSSIRVHTDEAAAEMNTHLGANAFTRGRDVYFARGQFTPETREGRRLLAHELTHVVQQGGGAAGLLQRQPVEKAKEFEQEVPIGMIEYSIKGGPDVSSGVTEALVAAAQKRLAKGPIKDPEGLRELRSLALADDTISDAERLFLAALLDPKNADRIKAIKLKSEEARDLRLSFTLDESTEKQLRAVAELGRPGAGRGKPDAQILALAGAKGADRGRVNSRAKVLLKFARDRKVPESDILEAMRVGGSDGTPGDMVAAAALYAIAVAASHPLAADVKAGRIKVDEMHVAEEAVYAPTGSGGLRKGDTIYVKPSFDVSDLLDRATAIHELEHARQDKAESSPAVKSGSELEPDAYVAGARYALLEIAGLPEKARPAAVKKLSLAWSRVDMYAAVVAGNAAADRLLPVLKAINAARKKDVQLTEEDFKKTDSELRELIAHHLGEHEAKKRVELTGQSGESVFDRLRSPKPPK